MNQHIFVRFRTFCGLIIKSLYTQKSMPHSHWFYKFQNESPVWVVISRSFFLLGLSLWFGALIFFASSAGIPFQIAKTWHLTGVNPELPTQIVSYRTIGGAITADMLLKLNILESIALGLTLLGFLLAWMPEHNRNWMLLVQTLVMAAMGIILLIYSQKIGVRMMEIKSTIPIDFSIENPDLKSSLHKEFDLLHKQYTRFVSINAILAFAQLILFAINPIATRKNHYDIIT